MSDSSTSEGAGDDLADALKTMFTRVVAADLDAAEKGRWHKRLIAITNTSKNDVTRAGEQLHRFKDEWNAMQRGKESSKNESDR